VVPPGFEFNNKGNKFLGIILGAENDSVFRFLISYHLGKLMPTFTMKKQRGDQGHFWRKFLYDQYIAQSTRLDELNAMVTFL